MNATSNGLKGDANRRGFIKRGLAAVGSATAGAGLLSNRAFGKNDEEHSGQLTKGDAAILRFLAAAEILETDFWVQYNELGGIQDNEVPGGSGNAPYTAALKCLMVTWINISTTTPRMSSPIRTSSTRTWLRKARQ